MPDAPPERLEWNEENLSQVVTGLYRQAETDQELHAQLMANPYDVLNTRIVVPPECAGGIFAREKNQKTLMLFVPPHGAAQRTLPAGTSEAEAPRDYELLCTTDTLW